MDDNWLAKIARNGKPSTRPPGRLPNVGAKVGHQHRQKTGTLDKIQEIQPWSYKKMKKKKN